MSTEKGAGWDKALDVSLALGRLRLSCAACFYVSMNNRVVFAVDSHWKVRR